MDRTAALQLLDSLERNGVGDAYAPAPQEVEWWKERYPLVPDRIWSLMRGQGVSWDEIEAPMPWNRRKRRRLERAKGGVVLHLFAGRGSHSEKWQSLGGTDTEVLTLDIAANPHEDVHSASVWGIPLELGWKGPYQNDHGRSTEQDSPSSAVEWNRTEIPQRKGRSSLLTGRLE